MTIYQDIRGSYFFSMITDLLKLIVMMFDVPADKARRKNDKMILSVYHEICNAIIIGLRA